MSVSEREAELIELVGVAAGETVGELAVLDAPSGPGSLRTAAQALLSVMESRAEGRIVHPAYFESFRQQVLRFATQTLAGAAMLDAGDTRNPAPADAVRTDITQLVSSNARRITSWVKEGRTDAYEAELPSLLESLLVQIDEDAFTLLEAVRDVVARVVPVSLADALASELALGVSELDAAQADVARLQAEADQLMAELDTVMSHLSVAMAKVNELEGRAEQGHVVTAEELAAARQDVADAQKSMDDARRRIKVTLFREPAGRGVDDDNVRTMAPKTPVRAMRLGG